MTSIKPAGILRSGAEDILSTTAVTVNLEDEMKSITQLENETEWEIRSAIRGGDDNFTLGHGLAAIATAILVLAASIRLEKGKG